jgi:hypothetical protein
VHKLTVIERILLAARSLGDETKSFCVEDLIVRAWEMYPESFGLQGYANRFPDSNRVLTKVMGAKSGLRKLGWLRRSGVKCYKLTPIGILKAEELSDVEGPDIAPRRLAELERLLVSVLSRLLKSSAVAKFSRGVDLTFADVSSYWNISPRSTASQLNVRAAEARKAIDLAMLHATDRGIQLPGELGTITRDQLRMLGDLGEHIEHTFAAELAIIRSRADERKL